jgi:hypothetical protein
MHIRVHPADWDVLLVHTCHSLASASSQCCRHRYFGIQHLRYRYRYRYRSSGTGLDSLISVPDSFPHRHIYSFLYRTDRMPYSPAFWHLKALYEDGEGYILLLLHCVMFNASAYCAFSSCAQCTVHRERLVRWYRMV